MQRVTVMALAGAFNEPSVTHCANAFTRVMRRCVGERSGALEQIYEQRHAGFEACRHANEQR
jgi:hypothetical protein